MPQGPEHVAGERFGLPMPTSMDVLERDGPDALTRAFQAAGALAADNRVVNMALEPFEGGGMGPKAKLDITYERDDPGLHTRLFVKLPRPFGDPLRALFAPVVEPEIRLYLLAHDTPFPVRVPRLYFGDFERESASSILITERVPYGENGVEPCHDKALDYRLADPLPYYEALSRVGARLAGAHKAGHLGDASTRAFPFDRDGPDPFAAIPYDEAQLAGKLATLVQFAKEAPSLLPEALRDEDFLQGFVDDAPLVLARESAIRTRLNHADDYVALCHWNLNLDNAWFEQSGDGELIAGLLDWGATSQMNLAQSFFGMICAAEVDFINAHRDGLLALWAREYGAAGGPAISAEALREHYRLAVAVLGMAWMIDAPALVMANIPDHRDLTGRTDPRLVGNFLARAQLQLLTVFLNEWRDLDLGAAVRKLA